MSKVMGTMKCIVTILMLILFSKNCLSLEENRTPRIYVFDCGTMTIKDASKYGLISVEKDVTLSVPCYVIEYANKKLLWNGGYIQERIDGVLNVGPAQSFTKQLKKINLSLSSFDYYAFSHAHYDHVGISNDITKGVFLIQEKEYESSIANEPYFQKLNHLPRRLLDGDYDLFGDGKVKIISAPGHTPGHQTLYVELEDYGPVLLSGDLYHQQSSFDSQVVPVITFDRKLQLSSMKRIDKILKETGATLWIEHEKFLFERLKKSPSYYE